MSERIKLILLRLWLVPYFFVSLFCTMILTIFVCCGYVLLGIPCWILTGNASFWVPDWDMGWYPTVFQWDDFKDDIYYRQIELNNKK